MRKPKKEELPYIFSIIVTSFGILYNFFPLSTPNIIILLGIDVLLIMALQRSLVLLRIETYLRKEREPKFFIDRGALPGLSERLERAKKNIWIMSESFGHLIGVDFGLLERKYTEGCEIRLLLLNPNVIKDKMMSNLDKDGLRSHLKTSINIIRKYKGKSTKGGVISGRLLPFEPGFGLFIIDEDSQEGEVKVELMFKNTTPYEWPNVIITRKEAKRYDQLTKHFKELWNLSDPI